MDKYTEDALSGAYTEADAQREIEVLNRHLEDEVFIGLTISDLFDLVECGALVQNAYGYKPGIMTELESIFAKLSADLNEAAEI